MKVNLTQYLPEYEVDIDASVLNYFMTREDELGNMIHVDMFNRFMKVRLADAHWDHDKANRAPRGSKSKLTKEQLAALVREQVVAELDTRGYKGPEAEKIADNIAASPAVQQAASPEAATAAATQATDAATAAITAPANKQQHRKEKEKEKEAPKDIDESKTNT